MNKLISTAIFILLTNFSMASDKTVGRITNVSGAGFISQNGHTQELKKGTLITTGSEIVTEHSGQVTYSDNEDHRFHLGAESSIAVTPKGVELRNGNVWIQSLNKNDTYKVITANAIVDFKNGEAVLTYDSVKGKTQLMVMNGLMTLSNFRVPDLNLVIAEGNFSYVDNSYDEGAPRDPTPVGTKTYNSLVSTFKGITPFEKSQMNQVAKREIASVHTPSTEHHEAKPAVVNHHSEKHDAINVDPALEEYKNSMLDKKVKVSLKKSVNKGYAKSNHKAVMKLDAQASPLIVQIYGQKTAVTASIPAVSNRAPASVTTNTEPKIENKITAPTKETEKLIDHLKSL